MHTDRYQALIEIAEAVDPHGDSIDDVSNLRRVVSLVKDTVRCLKEIKGKPKPQAPKYFALQQIDFGPGGLVPNVTVMGSSEVANAYVKHLVTKGRDIRFCKHAEEIDGHMHNMEPGVVCLIEGVVITPSVSIDLDTSDSGRDGVAVNLAVEKNNHENLCSEIERHVLVGD